MIMAYRLLNKILNEISTEIIYHNTLYYVLNECDTAEFQLYYLISGDKLIEDIYSRTHIYNNKSHHIQSPVLFRYLFAI